MVEQLFSWETQEEERKNTEEEGVIFCQESSYFSFALTKFETPVSCLYVMLNMVT